MEKKDGWYLGYSPEKGVTVQSCPVEAGARIPAELNGQGFLNWSTSKMDIELLKARRDGGKEAE